MFLAQVGDVRPAGFEDPQAEQAQEGEQGEVVRVRGLSGGGDQSFELQVPQAEGRRLGRHGGSADVVGWRVLQDRVDDADPIEADHDRQPAGHRRGLVPADVLQPAHVPLDIHPRRSQRVKAVLGAPAQEDPQIGLGVDASLTTVTAEEGRHRGAHNELIGQHDRRSGSRRDSHTSPCVTTCDERQPT